MVVLAKALKLLLEVEKSESHSFLVDPYTTVLNDIQAY